MKSLASILAAGHALLSSAQRLLLGAVLLSLGAGASAIVIRHDRADSDYRVEAEQYPQVFYLHERYGNKVCMATLVHEHWAITAAHCVSETPIQEHMDQGMAYPLQVAARDNAVIAVEKHPAYGLNSQRHPMGVDLALLRLEQPVSARPMALYTAQDEQDQVAAMLGWGFTGIGTRGRQFNDGQLRRARNRVSHAAGWLEFTFNDPRNLGERVQETEGVPALGDSGGPALLEAGDSMYLLGVARGELTEAEEGSPQGLYGSTSMYERISVHRGWITSIIGGDS